MPAYVPLKHARAMVQNREPFTGNSCYAENRSYPSGEDAYVVYSYGEHWPLFIYHPMTDSWLENSDRCSVTTSKHRSSTHPCCPTQKMPCSAMIRIAREGFGSACRDLIRRKAA